jgi:hypothetical protein
VIRRPENTVGEFCNYKGTESTILMAIVDVNYCFIYVNAGCQGRISDGGVFRNTEFYRKLENNKLYLPQDAALPGRTIPVPYTLVADDTFTLTRHTIKPYATDLNKGSPKRKSIQLQTFESKAYCGKCIWVTCVCIRNF